MTVRLYSRAGCHLCDEAAETLGRLAAEHPHRLETIDIDADPVLKARYGWVVPVVVVAETWRLVARIDERSLGDVLRRAQESTPRD